MAIRQTEVDGVSTIVAPTSGQTAAGLVFRVGRADETLARSGLTHLLEHLALFPFGLTDYHYNGSTGALTTSFHTTGSPEDVGAFLTKVCDSLAALPMARLETEKSIIRTEHSSSSNSPYQDMPLWRYGARGYGLTSYAEPGIWAITADELEFWRRTWFTKENAVLWVAGEVPAGLRLPLLAGQRWGLPPVTSALPQTPAFFSSDRNVVAMESVVRTSPAVNVFADVLERSLFRELRQDGGYSYAAVTAAERRGDGWTTVVAGVDALPEKVDAALGGFIDVLAALRAGRIDEADIAAYQSKLRDRVGHVDAEAQLLSNVAIELLTGGSVRDLQHRIAELSAVTGGDVHAVAREAWEAALLMVPSGRSADWAGFVAAPQESADTVAGRRFASRQSDRLSLFIAPEGVSRTLDGAPATVKYDQLVAMMAWPDGARRLIGEDATAVHIEPTLWDLASDAIMQVDAAVPPGLVIRFPAREPDQIPQPQQKAAAEEATGRGARVWTGGQLAILIGSIVAGVMMCCLAGALALAAANPTGGPDDIAWTVPIVSWVCMAVLFLPAGIVLIRHLRRKR